MAFNLAGYKPIMNFAFYHEEPSVSVEMQKKCAGKKVADSNQRIVECNVELSEPERDFFFKNKFLKKNVYDGISSTIDFDKDGQPILATSHRVFPRLSSSSSIMPWTTLSSICWWEMWLGPNL